MTVLNLSFLRLVFIGPLVLPGAKVSPPLGMREITGISVVTCCSGFCRLSPEVAHTLCFERL